MELTLLFTFSQGFDFCDLVQSFTQQPENKNAQKYACGDTYTNMVTPNTHTHTHTHTTKHVNFCFVF